MMGYGYRRAAAAMAVSLLLAGACKSQYDAMLASNDVDEKYKAAMTYFEEGKYQKAAALFESMAVLTSHTERDDTVQFYWGLSNYRYKDYFTAEANFSKFISVYPGSPFTEEARFLRLDCLYRQTLRYELDPSPTYKAISAMNEFVVDYPKSEYRGKCFEYLKELGARLDRKAYEAAKLYYRMEDYRAAQRAFKNILKDDPDNIYREDILYYIAMSSYRYAKMSVAARQRERYMVFIDDYLNFAGEYAESRYRRELGAMYARAQKSLGKFVGEAELLEGREKEFERTRREAEKREGVKAGERKAVKKAAAAEKKGK